LCPFYELVLNDRLDLLDLLNCLIKLPIQLPLYHFIVNLKEVIFPVYVFDLVFQALPRILELLTEVLVFFPNLLQGPLNELILPLNLDI
jgi:hypothetical protein